MITCPLCQGSGREDHLMPIRGRVQNIDACIAHIVAALNAANIQTTASCCGHGNLPGSIFIGDYKVDEKLMLITDRENFDWIIEKMIHEGRVRPAYTPHDELKPVSIKSYADKKDKSDD